MKYKILFPIAYGGRIEKGSVVELPDEIAKAYGPEYVQPVDGSSDTTEEAADEVVVDLSEMTLIDLKNKAKALGLSVTGGKADLIERITLHTADHSEEAKEEEVETEEAADEVVSEDEAEATDEDAE